MKELLAEQFRQLHKQTEWLNHSYIECKKIGIKRSYSVDEYGSFETLGSRYGRCIDFLIRKIFRALDAYEFENQGTLIDTVNNAEKRGLIESVDRFREMKELRNTVAHEYIEEKLIEIFDDLLKFTPKLLEISQKTLAYTEKILEKK